MGTEEIKKLRKRKKHEKCLKVLRKNKKVRNKERKKKKLWMSKKVRNKERKKDSASKDFVSKEIEREPK